jgi:hypothetical protein
MCADLQYRSDLLHDVHKLAAQRSSASKLGKLANQIETNRSKLRAEITKYREGLEAHMPQVHRYLTDPLFCNRNMLRTDNETYNSIQQQSKSADPASVEAVSSQPLMLANGAEPEMETLLLPSQIAVDQRDELAISTHLLNAELKLRIGLANDILHDVRAHMHQAQMLTIAKTKNSRGTNENLRSRGPIKLSHERKRFSANLYLQNRMYCKRLNAFDGSCAQDLRQTDKSFPDLVPKDLEMRALRQGHELDLKGSSWIWTTGFSGRALTEKDVLDSHKCQWFRTQAERDRLREEKALLHEEFRRSIRNLRFCEWVWGELACECATDGRSAYAHMRCDVYHQRYEEASKVFAELKGTWRSGDTPEAWQDMWLEIVQRRPPILPDLTVDAEMKKKSEMESREPSPIPRGYYSDSWEDEGEICLSDDNE